MDFLGALGLVLYHPYNFGLHGAVIHRRGYVLALRTVIRLSHLLLILEHSSCPNAQPTGNVSEH